MDFFKKLLVDVRFSRLTHLASTVRGLLYALAAFAVIVGALATAAADGDWDAVTSNWGELVTSAMLLAASFYAIFGTTDNNRTD